MDELRGGLIGCGFFAANHLNAWQHVAGARIVAICDRDDARLAEAGERFGIASRYADAEAMFRNERLDFVDIATTAPSHRTLVALAASHRVPTICQKPLAPSFADARAIVASAEQAGVPLMVHENFRWQSPTIAVRDALGSGRVGTPFWARLSFRSGFDVVSGQPYLAAGERFIIEDLGTHVLDLARFLLGPVERLSATTARVDGRVRGEDVATMLLRHRNGASAVVDCSYASRRAVEQFPQTLIEIEGTDGSLVLGLDYRLTITDRNGSETLALAPAVLPWATPPWHAVQESVLLIQRHWIDCLRHKRTPATSGHDNLCTLALVEAAYRSAATDETATPDPIG